MIEVPTPRGSTARFECRDGTSDAQLATYILTTDEYALAGRFLQGWALDVGAHIGIMSIALALDNPGLCILALEAVPENANALTRNVALNGLVGRVRVECVAASRPGIEFVDIDYGYIPDEDESEHPDYQDHTFIGNTYLGEGKRATRAARVPATSLSAVLDRHGIEEVSALKIDCEGCEWDFLQDAAVARVQTSFGETHGITAVEEHLRAASHEAAWRPGAHRCNCQRDHLHRLLDTTHDVSFGEVFAFEAQHREAPKGLSDAR